MYGCMHAYIDINGKHFTVGLNQKYPQHCLSSVLSFQPMLDEYSGLNCIFVFVTYSVTFCFVLLFRCFCVKSAAGHICVSFSPDNIGEINCHKLFSFLCNNVVIKSGH